VRLNATFVLVLALGSALAACKASVSAEANVKTGGEQEVADFDRPLDLREAERATRGNEETGEAALLGARQDLSYAGPATATCSCLAVAVGQPSDSSFKWSGARPTIASQTQLVVALTSSGVACSDATARGASYWGHEVIGEDVVVTVENAAEGRPVAQGAIIPRPLGSGQVYVKPAGKGVPYGRPLEGKGDRCKVSSLVPAQPAASPPQSSGVRIRTEEADPSSTRVEIP
jgi:hypothetical protein